MSNKHFKVVDTRRCIVVPTNEDFNYRIYFKEIENVTYNSIQEYVFLMTQFLHDPKVKQSQTTLEQCKEVIRYYLISGGKEKNISIEIKPNKTNYVKEQEEYLNKEKERLNG